MMLLLKKTTHVTSTELHGFCDCANAAVVYLLMTNTDGNIHITLVTSKAKVAPIKSLTILHLKLCGAHLLAQLLYHIEEVFGLPIAQVSARADSIIVLNWLVNARYGPFLISYHI